MANTAIFLANGFEEIEALTVVDMLRRKAIACDVVSITGDRNVTGSHGIKVIADKIVSEIVFDNYDALILPGGMPGTKNLEADGYLMSRFDSFYSENKLICAICAAPSIFGHRGYLKGKKATCYPGFETELEGANFVKEPVVKDGNVITSRGMGTAIEFGAEIVGEFLGEEEKEVLLKAIVYK